MTTSPASQLLLLLNWMSPAFPIGAFAYSHGLEQVIADGAVHSKEELRAWIEDLISHGSAWNDAVIFSRCWEDAPEELNELALALCSSRERWLEATQLGQAFEAASSIFLPLSSRGGAKSNTKGDPSYAVAAGTACAALAIDRMAGLLAFLQGFCAAQVSVAVRLVPLGQTAGLEVLRDLMPAIAHVAKLAATATLDDLGSHCIGADIAAMRHETLEPRIFRT